MLTLRDFLDYCDLTEEEVGRIVEKEHVPPIVAAQLALMRRHGIDEVSAALLHARTASTPIRATQIDRHPSRR
jgi:hypothetical protein